MNNSAKNSWYLNKPLAECRNLFQKDDNGYRVHFYHCQCGCVETIVTAQNQIPKYSCKACNNGMFIDGERARENDFTFHEGEMELTYDCRKIENGFEAAASIDIPVDTDFMRKQIVFTTYQVAHYTIYLDGKKEQHTKSSLENTTIKNTLEALLNEYIINSYLGPQKIPFRNKKEKVEAILFFLSHPNLLDFEFYYWEITQSLPKLYNPPKPVHIEDMLHYLLRGRRERTVKRALFQKHKSLQEKIKSSTDFFSFLPEDYTFDPQTAFVICTCIDDPNIASDLLTKDFVVFDTRYGHNDLRFSSDISYRKTSLSMKIADPLYLHDLIWFIVFLKKHNTEKQIAKLLLKVEADLDTWMDTLMLVKHFKGAVKKVFSKVKLSAKTLHDEVIRCSEYKENEKIQALQFLYKPKYRSACTRINDLEFKLPDSGAELSNWAHALQNCMTGYAYNLLSDNTAIYGVFRGNEIIYAVEIYMNTMEQYAGKYNQGVPTKDKILIDDWFEKFFQ